jgi:flagellar hook-length control protein FliK
MNVTDKWMLEQMQQMAAGLSALPQADQNSQPPKTEKGESFKDLMDKAKDKQTEAPEKADAPEKKEPVQSEKPAQKPEGAREVEVTKNADGTETKTVNLTAQEAAMVAAGYAKLFPQEDGTVLLVTAHDRNGDLILPLTELDRGTGAIPMTGDMLGNTGDEWVLEPTPEFVAALEQLLRENNDPRSAEDILSALEQKTQNISTADGGSVLEVVVKTASPEQSGEAAQEKSQEGEDNQKAEVMTASQPLFKDVKAAPVKVGENFQLDTEQPDMEQKLADTIRFAAQQDLRQIEIKLSPENLGNMTIKLTQASDGTLQVVLHTDNAKAANLLGQHLDNLNAALQSYNHNEVRVEVRENSQQPEQQQHQQTNPDGHNQQQQQQRQHQEDSGHSGDFVQKLRLGLFNLEDII